ncbi:MAG: Rap1a/Tai family immunity protein [Terriglobales bacterium]
MFRYLPLILAVALAAPATGQVLAARQLAAQCRAATVPIAAGASYRDGLGQGTCLGFVSAAALDASAAGAACLPPGSTVGDWARVVARYLAAHPELGQDSPAAVARAALAGAYPCPAPPPPIRPGHPGTHPPRP